MDYPKLLFWITWILMALSLERFTISYTTHQPGMSPRLYLLPHIKSMGKSAEKVTSLCLLPRGDWLTLGAGWICSVQKLKQNFQPRRIFNPRGERLQKPLDSLAENLRVPCILPDQPMHPFIFSPTQQGLGLVISCQLPPIKSLGKLSASHLAYQLEHCQGECVLPKTYHSLLSSRLMAFINICRNGGPVRMVQYSQIVKQRDILGGLILSLNLTFVHQQSRK